MNRDSTLPFRTLRSSASITELLRERAQLRQKLEDAETRCAILGAICNQRISRSLEDGHFRVSSRIRFALHEGLSVRSPSRT